MTSRVHEPRQLLTVKEAAKLLHVSDDTVRRQIKEGALEAVRVRTTPAGRAHYRIPTAVIDRILGSAALQLQEDADPFEPLRAAFESLSDEDREDLIDQAVQWARARRPVEEEGRAPALSKEALRERFAGNRFLLASRQEERDER